MIARRKSNGFTYLEVAIAFGIFMLLSLGTFAMLLHAARNFVAVHERTVGMHAARSMMYEVRAAVENDGAEAAHDAVRAAASRLYPIVYRVLVYNGHSEVLLGSYEGGGAAEIEPVFSASFPMFEQSVYVIVVLVFGGGGGVVGRSYGVVVRSDSATAFGSD